MYSKLKTKIFIDVKNVPKKIQTSSFKNTNKSLEVTKITNRLTNINNSLISSTAERKLLESKQETKNKSLKERRTRQFQTVFNIKFT